MAKTKTRPFKKVYCDRPEVFLLPSSAFKVWMYHYIREGAVRESWPSLPTICEKLNMNEETVKKARKWLKDNGWLKQIGSKTSKDNGKFKVPVMQVIRGTIPPKAEKPPMVLKCLSGRKNRLRMGAEKPPTDGGGKTAAEVEPILQVYKERQVDGFAKPFLNGKGSFVGAEAWDRVNVPQAENPPTVVPQAENPPTVESALAYERGYGWCARREIGRALTPEEIAEMKRRNTQHLTPADVEEVMA